MVLSAWMVVLVLPMLVSAQGTTPPPVGASTTIRFPNPLGNCGTAGSQLQCVLTMIIDKLIILAAPIVTIMVLWGAFQILTAAGDPEKFKTGNKTIMYAAIGFAIVLVSDGIAYILRDILGAGP